MQKNRRYSYGLPHHVVEYGVVIPVADLHIDPQAQRSLNERRAQKIADNLVPEAVGSIIVSRRPDGSNMIVDGFHRWRAFQLLGRKEMVAEVHSDLTQQEEAILFLIKNRESNKPNPYDEYKVGLTAGLPMFVDTDKVLRLHGLDLGQASSQSIGAVASVLRITDTYGPDILDRTLEVCAKAWGRTSLTWDAVLIGGVAMFLGKHGDIVDDTSLATKLAKVGPAQQWIGSVHSLASGGGLHSTGVYSRNMTCYQQIVAVWNKGKTKNRIVTR